MSETTMQRSRCLRATWLGRFLRGWLPDHNPLRRRTDRLEAAVFAVLFVLARATPPLVAAAAAASAWENTASQREIRVQQASCREVRATLLEDAHQTAAYLTLTPEAEAR